MVKFASTADYELEEKKLILKTNHVCLFSLHRFQLDLVSQTLVSGSPAMYSWQSKKATMGKQMWSFDIMGGNIHAGVNTTLLSEEALPFSPISQF